MAREVKVLADTPEQQSSIPETHMMEEQNQLCKLFSELLMHLYTYTLTNKINVKKMAGHDDSHL